MFLQHETILYTYVLKYIDIKTGSAAVPDVIVSIDSASDSSKPESSDPSSDNAHMDGVSVGSGGSQSEHELDPFFVAGVCGFINTYFVLTQHHGTLPQRITVAKRMNIL